MSKPRSFGHFVQVQKLLPFLLLPEACHLASSILCIYFHEFLISLPTNLASTTTCIQASTLHWLFRAFPNLGNPVGWSLFGEPQKKTLFLIIRLSWKLHAPLYKRIQRDVNGIKGALSTTSKNTSTIFHTPVESH